MPSNRCSGRSYGVSMPIPSTGQYGPPWKAWAYVSPWSPTVCRAQTQLDVKIPRRVHWRYIRKLQLVTALQYGRTKWYEDHSWLSIKSTVRQWDVNESVRSPIRWRWVCNDFKLHCFMDLLISYVQCMLGAGVCPDSCTSTPHPSDKSCDSARQDKAAWRANRSPLVRHCHSATILARHWARILFGRQIYVLWTLPWYAYVQQVGSAALCHWVMMMHACLDVMDDANCNWSGTEFVELPAAYAIIMNYGMDRTTESPADDHVWITFLLWRYCAFVQSFWHGFSIVRLTTMSEKSRR